MCRGVSVLAGATVTALTCLLAGAQSPSTATATAQFEAASIRPSACRNGEGRGMPLPGRFDVECITVDKLIQSAYGTFADGVTWNHRRVDVLGGPGWMRSKHYDIHAKALGYALQAQTAGPMLRNLLEDRFQLRIHREMKEEAVYALTIAPGGPKLPRTEEGSCTIPGQAAAPAVTGEAPPERCGSGNGQVSDGNIVISVHGISVGDWAEGWLSTKLDRPVIDQTGIEGLFDLRVAFSIDAVTPGFRNPGDPDPSGLSGPTLSIFAAVEKQLGLKLKPTRGSVPVLVVDSVEHPTEN